MTSSQYCSFFLSAPWDESVELNNQELIYNFMESIKSLWLKLSDNWKNKLNQLTSLTSSSCVHMMRFSVLTTSSSLSTLTGDEWGDGEVSKGRDGFNGTN
jgi:hypothetical protein